MTDAPIIAEYSPNIRWGKQHVEIILKQWKYESRFVKQIGGNCTGMDVLDCALDDLYDDLADGRDVPEVILTAPDGETLSCMDEEGLGERWLKRMCVSLRIVAYDPPTLNEVRARNGADSVPDGDRPIAVP